METGAEWWQVVFVAALASVLAASRIAAWRRRSRPEEQRIAEAERRYFAGAGPEIAIDLSEANLSRELLMRLALQHGYELERTAQRRAGAVTVLTYHLVFRGPEAKPAACLPESPDHEAFLRWDAARKRRTRRVAAALWLILAALVGAAAVRLLA